MTEVTRFPHYHQAENVVTNHVMVMLRMIYDKSPKLLERLLQAICGSEVTVGPRFSQQIAGSHSVPDGLVQQIPFAVFVETKLGSTFSAGQLESHCRSIIQRTTRETKSCLLALGAGSTASVLPDPIQEMAAAHGIDIVPLTFGRLAKELEALNVSDITLEEIIREFTDFLFAQGLIPRDDQFLVAVLSNHTWQENAAHSVFYDPAERSPKWTRAAFIGLYHDRRISHVGRLLASVVAIENDAGELTFETPEKGQLLDSYREAIRNIVDATQMHYPGFQKERHRYYVVDRFTPVDFRKRTPYGMMGHRYFDLEEISGQPLAADASGEDAARVMSGRTFD